MADMDNGILKESVTVRGPDGNKWVMLVLRRCRQTLSFFSGGCYTFYRYLTQYSSSTFLAGSAKPPTHSCSVKVNGLTFHGAVDTSLGVENPDKTPRPRGRAIVAWNSQKCCDTR
jgi:hypothetical protein